MKVKANIIMENEQEQYIQVVEFEGDGPVEIPTEPEGYLLLSTLSAQFPGATGLKFRNDTTGNWRGLRLTDGKILPPESTWNIERLYCIVYPKEVAVEKRKADFSDAETSAKLKRSQNNQVQSTTDIVLLNLSFQAEEEDLKEYFSKYGTVLMTQIKRNPVDKQSKGFGFIRMAEYEAQCKILEEENHLIKSRWTEARLPNQDKNKPLNDTQSRRIFVGRCSEDLTQEDLRKYFSAFGSVMDVYIPKPFRSFAFVTFASGGIATSLYGQDHIINGCSVHIGPANEKKKERNDDAPNEPPPSFQSSAMKQEPDNSNAPNMAHFMAQFMNQQQQPNFQQHQPSMNNMNPQAFAALMAQMGFVPQNNRWGGHSNPPPSFVNNAGSSGGAAGWANSNQGQGTQGNTASSWPNTSQSRLSADAQAWQPRP